VSTKSPQLFTLTKGVALLVNGSQGQQTMYPMKLAAALIMTIPVAVIFFIFQRKIVNTTTGAVKE
jgi:multiple sugar transport system permease protein